jgi:hypothetical protein
MDLSSIRVTWSEKREQAEPVMRVFTYPLTHYKSPLRTVWKGVLTDVKFFHVEKTTKS